MTQEEILNYNKKCTKFLGYKCSINELYELPNMMTFKPKKGNNLCRTAKICTLDEMEFHNDWNWIMESVEFIERLYNHPNKEIQVHIKAGEVCIFSMPYFLENNYYKEVYYLGEGYLNSSKIEAVFIAVSDFAKLYNEGKL